MTQISRALPKVQIPSQPQFKIDAKTQQQRPFRVAPSTAKKSEIQQRNNIPLTTAAKPADANLFSVAMVNLTPVVVSKTLLEKKLVNNVLIETYQFKYSDNSFLNKIYFDGFLVSSVDPVGGTRVNYQTNIQAASNFANQQQNSVRYQPGPGFINNLNYNPYSTYNPYTPEEVETNGEQNLNPNYQNRFLSNLIV